MSEPPAKVDLARDAAGRLNLVSASAGAAHELNFGNEASFTSQQFEELTGCDVAVLERNPVSPAAVLATHSLVGDWDAPAELLRRVDDALTRPTPAR